MGLGSYSFLAGPLIALVAIGGLLLVSRWMTGQHGSLIERPATRGGDEEYGLMIPVASPRTATEAHRVVGLLTAGGLRAHEVETTDGLRVMVWAEDVGRARAMLDDPSR